MSYGPWEFVEHVVDALKITPPGTGEYDASECADLVLAEIEKLRASQQPGLHLDDQQAAMVIAALRMIQRMGVQDEEDDVASGGGQFAPLGDDEIDSIIELVQGAPK